MVPSEYPFESKCNSASQLSPYNSAELHRCSTFSPVMATLQRWHTTISKLWRLLKRTECIWRHIKDRGQQKLLSQTHSSLSHPTFYMFQRGGLHKSLSFPRGQVHSHIFTLCSPGGSVHQCSGMVVEVTGKNEPTDGCHPGLVLSSAHSARVHVQTHSHSYTRGRQPHYCCWHPGMINLNAKYNIIAL